MEDVGGDDNDDCVRIVLWVLSLAFLREFMNLPNSYFDAGAPLKFRKYMFVENNDIFNSPPGKRV